MDEGGLESIESEAFRAAEVVGLTGEQAPGLARAPRRREALRCASAALGVTIGLSFGYLFSRTPSTLNAQNRSLHSSHITECSGHFTVQGL